MWLKGITFHELPSSLEKPRFARDSFLIQVEDLRNMFPITVGKQFKLFFINLGIIFFLGKLGSLSYFQSYKIGRKLRLLGVLVKLRFGRLLDYLGD